MNLNYRYDYFLIWGNGLSYKDDIIDIVSSVSAFEIVMMVLYKPHWGIRHFVRQIYNFDYAPYEHLKDKVRYLLKTKNEVFIIFVRNHDVREEWTGEGEYFHLESASVREVKNAIRDRYNERKSDRRTENHVIHGSDNEAQTEYLLKIIGVNVGTKLFEKRMVNNLPYHLPDTGRYRVVKIETGKLFASVLMEEGVTVLPLSKTPQYRGLTEGMDVYANYLRTYQGTLLRDYYSVKKYEELRASLTDTSYLEAGCFVTVKKIKSGYLILDGVHRASVLAIRGIGRIVVMEIISDEYS